VLEAFFYGKPVIGSNLGGIPEMVTEGETGSLFQPGDAGELATKMAALMDDGARRKKLGAAARKLAEEKFSHEAHYEGLVELYGRLTA